MRDTFRQTFARAGVSIGAFQAFILVTGSEPDWPSAIVAFAIGVVLIATEKAPGPEARE